MWDEIEKLDLKKGIWQKNLEMALPIDNAKVEVDYPDSHTVYFRISENNQPVAKFAMSFLYGCKGVLVSHTMLVEEGYRNRGIAKEIQNIKQQIAKDLKVAIILSTVIETNKNQEAVIKHWDKVGSFNNPRTGNKVNIWTVPVK